MAKLPTRWQRKHGAFYYLPRPHEKPFFDNKSWYRLGDTYPEALKVYAERLELQMGDDLASAIDRYTIEALPKLKPNTRDWYGRSLARLKRVLGHNPVNVIEPQGVYQYMARVAKEHTKNVANSDLVVLIQVLSFAVRWGVINRNPIKGEVKKYGKRDGVNNARDRYVEDWELAEWSRVAGPVQRAFAALALLTGARKSDILRIRRCDIKGDKLKVGNNKTGRAAIYQITPALREAIDTALSTHPRTGSLFLLCNQYGRCFVTDQDRSPTFDRSWRQVMTKAIEQTQLEEWFTMHDLRAKVGSDADTDERAQQLLGHTNPSMTRKHYRRKVPVLTPTR